MLSRQIDCQRFHRYNVVVVSSFHCAFLALKTGTGELSDELEFLVRVR